MARLGTSRAAEAGRALSEGREEEGLGSAQWLALRAVPRDALSPANMSAEGHDGSGQRSRPMRARRAKGPTEALEDGLLKEDACPGVGGRAVLDAAGRSPSSAIDLGRTSRSNDAHHCMSCSTEWKISRVSRMSEGRLMTRPAGRDGQLAELAVRTHLPFAEERVGGARCEHAAH